ncbi:MAG: Gfo/Idh/MocA family oxidoreductase [Clostridia bacterium]|nr:Gfo/Idh/MocA family oxidoreductase [Clostridia bacterium]
MKQMRIGIIGVGNIGTAHARTIFDGKEPLLTLAFLCDNDKDRLSELKREFPNVPLFDAYEDAISSGICDGVIIATPHYFHPVISEVAIKNHLHVLCEKPLGVYTKGLSKLCDMAEENKVVFSVMLNQRANKLFIKARELIKSGAIGKIVRGVWIITNWYRTQEYYESASWRGSWRGEGGGVLMNQAPHNLDIFYWLLGMPISVKATVNEGKGHKIEVEDEASVYFEYGNGASGVFVASTLDKHGTNRLEITGEKGKIVLERGALVCEYETESGEISTLTENDEKYEGHLVIISNFARAVLYGEELIAPARDGINQLMMCNGAYLSSWLDETVLLPLDEGKYLQFLKKKVENSTQGQVKHKENLFLGTYNKRWDTNW